MDGWRQAGWAAALAALGAAGCLGPGSLGPPAPVDSPAGVVLLDNPFFTPITDREFLWNHLVDTMDDYFRIAREQRVRVVGDVMVEGRLETFPQPGATALEPWRRDSTPGFERWHATLQSVRRRAEARVTPTAGGYLVEVAVYKELEDLERPEHATASPVAARHDGGLARTAPQGPGAPATQGWIPLGRDLSLEQQILRDLIARLGVNGRG